MPTAILVWAMDSVLREFNEITRFCLDLKFLFKATKLEELKLKEFANYLTKNGSKFTAANFFSVQRSVLLGVLLIFVNFEIAIIQLTIK